MTSSVLLPEPRDAESPYTIAFVCLGNICRSPTAQAVMDGKLAAAGLDRVTKVHSAGTGEWHIGEQMDRRAAATLIAHGYDPTRHRATLFDASWFEQHDLVLAMDSHNFRDIGTMVLDEADRDRIMMFRSFDPRPDEDALDVPDPWYGGQDGFDQVLGIVERTCDVLVGALATRIPQTDVGPDEPAGSTPPDVRSSDDPHRSSRM